MSKIIKSWLSLVSLRSRCVKYIIYSDELSLFTRKLESARVFYGLDFERREESPDLAAEIEYRAGTH